jgi:hypothetical protein
MSTLLAAAQTWSGAMALRFLLGLTEAGLAFVSLEVASALLTIFADQGVSTYSHSSTSRTKLA